MKLYVCWGTFWTPRPGGHPCHNAYDALRKAGHDPDVIQARGLGVGPGFLQNTDGRKEVKRMTGQSLVPVLLTDTGEVIHDSKRIVEWAGKNPAAAAAATS